MDQDLNIEPAADQPIRARTMAAVLRFCRRWSNFAVGPGLEKVETAAGVTLRLAVGSFVTCAKLVGQLPAGDGILQMGKGQCRPLGFNPQNGQLTAPVGDPEPIYNLLNAAFKDGSTVLAVRCYGTWFYVLTICPNVVT